MDQTPKSTDFIELHGHLSEWSELNCKLPGVTARLEEYPPVPKELNEALQAAGLKDTAEGKASFEVHLEMPGYEQEQLEIIIARDSRRKAVYDAGKLEKLLKEKKVLPGEVKAHILSYPSENTIVPAMLWVDTALEEIGEISISAAADTLSQALKAMRRVMPGVSMNS